MSEKEEGRELVKKGQDIEVITPAEQEEGDKRFKLKVVELIVEEKDVTKALLYHHWRKGQFVEDLLGSPKKYGNHTIDDLYKPFGIGKSTLGSWHRFYLKYQKEEDMKKLVDSGANWRDVSNVLSVEDEKQRADLLKKRLTCELSSDELAKRVSEINKEAKEEAKAKAKAEKKRKPKAKKVEGELTNKEAKGLLNTIRSANSIVLTATSTMDDFKEAYDEFQKLEESKFKSDIQAALQDSFKNVAILSKKLLFILEHRDKVIAKRKAAAEAAKKS